ncbi:hypothetical protein ACM66B_006087 [Microbotryomycetes sp. NB124-2]
MTVEPVEPVYQGHEPIPQVDQPHHLRVPLVRLCLPRLPFIGMTYVKHRHHNRDEYDLFTLTSGQQLEHTRLINSCEPFRHSPTLRNSPTAILPGPDIVTTSVRKNDYDVAWGYKGDLHRTQSCDLPFLFGRLWRLEDCSRARRPMPVRWIILTHNQASHHANKVTTLLPTLHQVRSSFPDDWSSQSASAPAHDNLHQLVLEAAQFLLGTTDLDGLRRNQDLQIEQIRQATDGTRLWQISGQASAAVQVMTVERVMQFLHAGMSEIPVVRIGLPRLPFFGSHQVVHYHVYGPENAPLFTVDGHAPTIQALGVEGLSFEFVKFARGRIDNHQVEAAVDWRVIILEFKE